MATVTPQAIYHGSTLIWPIDLTMATEVTPDAPVLTVGVDQLFTAVVTGNNGPFTYQWRKSPPGGEFTDIGGATADTFNYTPVIEENGWLLRCVATDKFGHKAGQSETLTINYPATTVSIAADDIDVIEGAVITFTATPGGGDGNYTYQWNLDGAPISGATAASYPRTTVIGDNGKVITCTVTSAGSPATSNGLTMVVAPAYTPPVYVGKQRFGNNGLTDVFTPAGLEVGGIIVAFINQRNTGTRNPGFTAGATILHTENISQRVMQIVEYTGGSCTITYGDSSDTQVCMYYFNNATYDAHTNVSGTNDGPAVTLSAEGWVINGYSWSGTENINPTNTTAWGEYLPGTTTWPNVASMAKAAAAGAHDPGAWQGMGVRSGINGTVAIKGK